MIEYRLYTVDAIRKNGEFCGHKCDYAGILAISYSEISESNLHDCIMNWMNENKDIADFRYTYLAAAFQNGNYKELAAIIPSSLYAGNRGDSRKQAQRLKDYKYMMEKVLLETISTEAQSMPNMEDNDDN